MRLRRGMGLRFAGLIGLMLLVAGCDKCGDWIKINSPKIPKNCVADDSQSK